MLSRSRRTDQARCTPASPLVNAGCEVVCRTGCAIQGSITGTIISVRIRVVLIPEHSRTRVGVIHGSHPAVLMQKSESVSQFMQPDQYQCDTRRSGCWMSGVVPGFTRVEHNVRFENGGTRV